MKLILLVVTLFLSFKIVFSQDFQAYTVFTKTGKKSSFQKAINESLKKDFIFFGELHNNPIAHWLQLEMALQLENRHKNNLQVGFEMFERDNQQAINNYLNGKIETKYLKDSVRLWSNYQTDYKPIVDFAKEKNIACIATNIPRKYASLVFKKGMQALDSLSAEELKWICPLPFPLDTNLSQYAALLDGNMHMGKNFVKAQAIKDATMGHSIAKNWKKGKIHLHLNGSYHSDFFQGIIWYLKHYASISDYQIITISVVEQTDISKLEKEYLGKADYIICVPENMTKTH
jgi:uncharacterized iron-regulated protein